MSTRGRALSFSRIWTRRAGVALVMAGGLAMPAAWGADARIVSDPGQDLTYTPVGTPDVIRLEVTFDAAVSVSGQPTFDLAIGRWTRQMSYASGSGTATLLFTYTVQSGDLDEDGVSHGARALRGGTITDLRDATPVDRTVAVLARADGHRVDGVAPRFAGMRVTSHPAAAGTFAPGEEVVVAVRFDEDVASAPASLELDFDGSARRAARTGIADDTVTYSYTVVAGDVDGNGIRIPVNSLNVADAFGNAADRDTTVLATSLGVDGVAPSVSRATIVSNAGGDSTYRAGDRIEVEVVFSERVRNVDDSTFALLMGPAEAESRRRAAYLSGEGTDRVAYRYTVVAGDVDSDGISFGADALEGPITDRVGIGLLADTVPAVAEQASHRVDGGEDNEAPRVTGVAVTSEPAGQRTYGIGDRIEVSVRFSEPVTVTNDANLKLVVSVGSDEVRADFDGFSDETDRLRFHYLVAEGDLDANGIAVGPIAETLVGGAIEDFSGNTAMREFARLRDQAGHRVDGILPTVTRVAIVSRPGADDTYALGDDIEVDVHFSEVVVADHEPGLDLVIDIGTEQRRAHLASGDGTSTLTFRYRVQQDDFDADGISIGTNAFVDGRPQDLGGNDAAAAQDGLTLDNQAGHRVDALSSAPAGVTVVSNAGADGTYARGDVIELEVTFGEEVVVSGAPQLALTFGESGEGVPVLVRADLARQLPQQLTFRYEVRDGDWDPDGISVGASALIGDIVDLHGNPARLLTPLADDEEHRVDGIEPAPVGTEIVSRAGADDTYGLGEAIELAVSFTEVVHVTEFGGDLVLRISIGEHTRNAVFVAGSGTRELRFRYVVTEADRDDDGVSLGARALGCYPELDDCSISDQAGNPLDTSLQGMPAQRRHRVDGRRSEARLSILSTPVRSGTYGVGEHIDLGVAFPRPVFVLSRTEAPVLPELAVSVGGAEAVASFDGGSGTNVLRFRYTVQAGDFDDDGISVAAGPGSLRGGLIEDAEGAAMPRNFAALAPEPGQRVDAVRPSAVGVEIVSSPRDEDYGLGESIDVEVSFDEVVHVTEGDSQLELVLAVGEHSRRAFFVDGSGTDTLSFSYRIGAADRDDDGISIGPDALVGGVIEDVAGNETGEAERRLPALPAQPGHKVNPDIDTVAPTVARVAIASMPEDATYRADEAIEVEVVFDEDVHVSGEPTLELSIGAAARRAGFASGSGTTTLTFRYVVQAGDADADGISVGPGTISLTGGDIRDGAGNAAVRWFEGLQADSRHAVNGQRTMASVAEVRIASSPKIYREGDEIDVDVEFSEVVHVTGGPALTLSIGARDRAAAYATGSGTDTLRFSYAVQSGDFDGDGISIGANALSGGTIADAAGTDAVLDLPAVPEETGHRVDAVPATVTDVSISSEPGADDTYAASDAIEIAVVFDEEVLVSGDPVVTLSVGAATRFATFTGGGGTATLGFAYVVQPGDLDSDGVSVPANSLAGAAITDLAGNAAVRDFAGLAADADHRVAAGTDIDPPTVVAVGFDAPEQGDTYLLGEEIEVRVSFDEEVHVTGQPSVALSVGARTRSAAFASGSGTGTLVFRYRVEAGDSDDDGLSIGSGALTGGGIRDAAGNAAERGFDAVPADPGRKVDGLVPVVESVAIASDPGDDGIYAPGDVIEVAVEFDGIVLVTGAPVLSLGIGANTRTAAYSDGSGTARLVFRYVVRDDDYDGDGISIPANALAGGAVEDASGNPADRSYSALGAQDGHTVIADVAVPTVAAVDIAPPAAGDTFLLGEMIEIRVAFSEAVHVTGRPSVVLSVGPETRSAGYASGSGTDMLVFRYEVQPGDLDDDGLSIGPDALTGGGVEDGAGNVAERGFDAVAADPGRKVDGVVPAVDSVAVVSVPEADGIYQPGEEIRVAVTFDGAVRVEGVPVLTLAIGAQARAAEYASGTGTANLEFRYVVSDDDYDEDGIAIAGDALTGGTIEDLSGNPAERSFAALGPLAGHRVVADVVAPTVASVVVVPPDEGDIYLLGEDIEIRISFNEVVHVTGRPTVMLSVGAVIRSAPFASGSGTDTLVFRYEVQPGDADDDGVSIAADALTGGGIADAVGNAADRGFDALPADAGRKVDGIVPAVESVAVVSDPGADQTYARGDMIEVVVTFDGVVQVERAPVLKLDIGDQARDASYASGSGTERLEFRYTVRRDDRDDDGIAIASDALTGGVIEDLSGNPAGREFEALGPLAGHTVATDVVAPTIAEVSIEPPADGDTYLLGEAIEVRVRFSEVVHVTGQPSVGLSVGAATRSATFASGSGTDTLAFRYEVQPGDADDDGVSIATGTLTGGTIEDGAGNAAERGFDVPADRGHPVDGAVPSVRDVAIESDPGTDETHSPGDVIEVAVTFNDDVHVTGAPVLMLGIGANSRSAAYADGSGTGRLLFRYTVQDNDVDNDGISIAANALTGGAIEDASGNPVDRAFDAQMFPGHKVGPVVALTLTPLSLEVGRDETIDLTATLAQANVVYAHGFLVASDNDDVAVARSTGGLLTITPVSEGTATITATARRAPVTVLVPVAVEASAAETAVLEHALAAVGRGLLSSVSATIGARLENGGPRSRASGQRVSPVFGERLAARGTPVPGPDRTGFRFDVSPPPSTHHAGVAGVRNGPGFPGAFGDVFDPRPAWDAGMSLPTSFAIPVSGMANPALSWGIWGGVDAQSFEGDPEHGAYDGQVTSAYLGADAVGAGWVAGAAVSRSQADVSYEYGGDASGAGTLEASLTSVYPYLQASMGDRSVFWAVLGFGEGEAEAQREGGPAPEEPGALSMSLVMGGLRIAVGRPGGLDLALRGDGGTVQLETEEGLRAINGLGVRAQRVRVGVEASWPVTTGDGEMTPFIDLGGRWDGGNGDAAAGVEVAGGLRYRGALGGFEVMGRTLAQHGAEGYSESGVAATLFLAPRADGRGLRLSLTPRRGIAESTGRFWQNAYGLRPFGADRRVDRDWTFDGRIGYGFGLRKRAGTVTPFGVAQLAGERDRTRVGMSYELGRAASGLPLRVDVSLERDERRGGRAEHGLLVTLEARF